MGMTVQIDADTADRVRGQGYAVVEDAFDDEELERFRDEADRILELLINSSLAHGRTSGRLDVVADGDGNRSIRKVQPVNDLSLPFADLARDERIVDPIETILDDSARLMEEKLNYKQPLPDPVPELGTSRPSGSFPIHSDWAYYKEQDYPQATTSAAIALDDLTTANGTMRFWPGTNDDFIEHVPADAGGLEVPPERVDEDDAEVLEAPAGSLLLFDSVVWHDSSPNETDRPRRLMIYSYYPAGVGSERGIVEDERNAPTRRRESPYEWEYQRRKDAGEFEDRFSAPALE
jgi:ectoine hydroxylase-related dioxygenase (phytanoyl-CoA dioxygenase family)